jgi:uncharacterized membrane protein
VQFVVFLKDEWCSFTFTFMKIKLRNQITMHLEVVIQMFNHKFNTMQNFFLEQQSKVGKIIEIGTMQNFEG